jgi:hypothetical protein
MLVYYRTGSFFRVTSAVLPGRPHTETGSWREAANGLPSSPRTTEGVAPGPILHLSDREHNLA